MVRRNKSGLEKLFSLKRYKRRRGAASVPLAEDFQSLRNRMIEAGPPNQTRGSSDDLQSHLDALRREFSGQSELVFEHARLVVLIRREYRTVETFARFKALWDSEGDFLLQNLNLRWIISATDTFADHDPDPVARAIALSASIMVNTLKTYESERHITDVDHPPVNPDRIAHLQSHLVPIFSGLSMLTVGTDDTLRNMRWRIDRQAAEHPMGAILRHVFLQLQEEDSAFLRLRRLHHRDRTAWW